MKPRQLLGALVLVVVVVAVLAFTLLRGGDSGGGGGGGKGSAIVVKGYLGGEKANFVADPEVQKVLKDKYGITVNGTKAGSIEMVRDIPLGQDVDFVWPADQVALAIYKERQGTLVKADNVFNSPIVLYSWAPVVDALVQAGIARQGEGGSYTVDLPKLVELVVEGRQWSDLGLTQLHGGVTIHTTDPAVSNSGYLFAGLLANVLNGGDVVNSTTVEPLLPTLQSFYGRLGFMEQSSGDIFQQFLATGIGAKPIIAGYESQLAEFSLQNESYRQQIKDQVRVLYPQPTVWSSHPLIARTANGAKLLDALKDPQILKLAWERHGFRSGLAGVSNDPSVLQIAGIPAQITSVIDMPSPAAMDRILQALKAVAVGTPTAGTGEAALIEERRGAVAA
jgi:Bacterial extracellular solute-binding protein